MNLKQLKASKRVACPICEKTFYEYSKANCPHTIEDLIAWIEIQRQQVDELEYKLYLDQEKRKKLIAKNILQQRHFEDTKRKHRCKMTDMRIALDSKKDAISRKSVLQWENDRMNYYLKEGLEKIKREVYFQDKVNILKHYIKLALGEET